MTNVKSTITRNNVTGKYVVEVEGYENEEVTNSVLASELLLLRANPHIGTQLRRLLVSRKYNQEWGEPAARGAMLASQNLVMAPEQGEPDWGHLTGNAIVTAIVCEYDTPGYEKITWEINREQQSILSCTCAGFTNTKRGLEQRTKEMVTEPNEYRNGRDNIFCKHIFAFLFAANTPNKLPTKLTKDNSMRIATLAVIRLRNKFLSEFGGDGTPEWSNKMRAVGMADLNTLVVSVPEKHLQAVKGEENESALNRMFNESFNTRQVLQVQVIPHANNSKETE